MKEFLFLVVGLLLGFPLGHAYWPSQSESEPPTPTKTSSTPMAEIKSAPEPSLPAASPTPTVPTPAPAAAPLPGATPTPAPTATPTPAPAATPAPSPAASTPSPSASTPASSAEETAGARNVPVSFSKEFVDELEKEWKTLPKQVRLKKEPRGWRVVRITPGSTFARTGLQKGDLITRESVEGLRAAFPGEEQLPERLVKILNRVSPR